MGTWGPGNFENDTAAEYLSDLCKPLVEQITQTLAQPELMHPQEPDSEVMLANVEILSVLAENVGRVEKGWVGDMVFPFPFPAPATIEQWKRDYMKVWDGCIGELEPAADYKQKRREIIVATFERLLQASRAGPPTNSGEQS